MIEWLIYYSNRFASVMIAAVYDNANYDKIREWYRLGLSLPVRNAVHEEDLVEEEKPSTKAAQARAAYNSNFGKVCFEIAIFLWGIIPDLVKLSSANIGGAQLIKIKGMESNLLTTYLHGTTESGAEAIIMEAVTIVLRMSPDAEQERQNVALRKDAVVHFLPQVVAACKASVMLHNRHIPPTNEVYDLATRFQVCPDIVPVFDGSVKPDFFYWKS